MSGLRIARDLELPIEFASEASGIMGRRGSGKSNIAARLTECMLDAGVQVITLDPKGESWSLRLRADGKRRAYDLPVFGGLRGDVPLEAQSGPLVADTLIERNLSAVIDVSRMGKTARLKFAWQFAERLLQQRQLKPAPTCLVLEEAKFFCPQDRSGDTVDGKRMRSAFNDFPLVGRSCGFGMVVVTQRPALVDSTLRSQIECLITLQITGLHDRKAIEQWVVAQGDQKDMDVSALAGLHCGEGWVWSPGWLRILKKVKFDKRKTFDAGATPVASQKRIDPKPLNEGDLGALRTAMVDLVERAKADDPVELRRRIRDLEKAAKRGEDVDRASGQLREAADTIAALKKERDAAMDALHRANAGLEGIQAMAHDIEIRARNARVDKDGNGKEHPMPFPSVPGLVSRTTNPSVRPFDGAGEKMPAGERKVLTALAQHGALEKAPIGILSGYAVNGGGFNNILSALRSKGWVDGFGAMEITEDGRRALGSYKELPMGSDLVDWWKERVGAAEREILRVLIDHSPDELTKDEIAAKTTSPRGEPYVANGGGFNNAMSKLRTLQLISGSRRMKASHHLCP